MRYFLFSKITFLSVNLFLSKFIFKFNFVVKVIGLTGFWCILRANNFLCLKFMDYLKFREVFTRMQSILYMLNFVSLFDLRIEGLGFRFRKLWKKKYEMVNVILGHATFKYFFFHNLFIYKIYEEKQLFLYSIFKENLLNFVVHLLNLRIVKPYSLIGVLDRKRIYILRLGRLGNLDRNSMHNLKSFFFIESKYGNTYVFYIDNQSRQIKKGRCLSQKQLDFSYNFYKDSFVKSNVFTRDFIILLYKNYMI